PAFEARFWPQSIILAAFVQGVRCPGHPTARHQRLIVSPPQFPLWRGGMAHRFALVFLLVLTFALPAAAGESAVTARHGMVVAQGSRAARIGGEILEKGGNAVDAAVAVGFAMAVTYPRAGNIGGGGYMVIHLARPNRQIAIDYRETAPKAATRDMF